MKQPRRLKTRIFAAVSSILMMFSLASDSKGYFEPHAAQEPAVISMVEEKEEIDLLDHTGRYEMLPMKKEETVLAATSVQYSSGPKQTYSDEEYSMIAKITAAEAGNQPELGIRWVIDCVYNRLESPRWPNTVRSVIFAPGQFTSTVDGNYQRAKVRDDILRMVKEEETNRTQSEVTSFRTGHYHSWATPVAKIGDHYFSK